MKDTITTTEGALTHVRHVFDNGIGVHCIYADMENPPEDMPDSVREVMRDVLCMAAPMVRAGKAWVSVPELMRPVADEKELASLLEFTENHESLGLPENMSVDDTVHTAELIARAAYEVKGIMEGHTVH